VEKKGEGCQKSDPYSTAKGGEGKENKSQLRNSKKKGAIEEK